MPPQTGARKANFHTENGIISIPACRVIAKPIPRKNLPFSGWRSVYSVDRLLGEESMSDVMTRLGDCITANSILARCSTKRSRPESNRRGKRSLKMSPRLNLYHLHVRSFTHIKVTETNLPPGLISGLEQASRRRFNEFSFFHRRRRAKNCNIILVKQPR